jgi:hypothetical protein
MYTTEEEQMEQFFEEHQDRNYHIRLPLTGEFEKEFISLGAHAIDRRRIIVKRLDAAKVAAFGVKYMPIPFLLFADESIEDTDEVLAPIFDGIMREAAADLR